MKKALPTWFLAVCLGVALLPPAAAAEPPLWLADPPHSRATFMIRHIYVPITGWFDAMDVQARFDPKDLPGSSLELTIKASSINTGIAARDEHLRSADFFDAAHYPDIRFTSKDISHVKGDEYLARGELIVKDVTARVEMPFRYLGQKENPMHKGQMVAGFEAQVVIDRLFFHVGDGKWYKRGLVGKDATVLLGVEAVRQP